MKSETIKQLTTLLGEPTKTDKILRWRIGNRFSVAVQIDAPKGDTHAFIWVPRSEGDEPIPHFAEMYEPSRGRHSNTYPLPGLERGRSALRYRIETPVELDAIVRRIAAIASNAAPPPIALPPHPTTTPIIASPAVENRERRAPIPKAVQRDVWRRDEARCSGCGSKERLEFDHIIPLSKGGSNTARNIQLLCETCNRSKGNRI